MGWIMTATAILTKVNCVRVNASVHSVLARALALQTNVLTPMTPAWMADVCLAVLLRNVKRVGRAAMGSAWTPAQILYVARARCASGDSAWAIVAIRPAAQQANDANKVTVLWTDVRREIARRARSVDNWVMFRNVWAHVLRLHVALSKSV